MTKILKNKTNKKAKALYIHVPFCQEICSYCDFPKLYYYPLFAKQYLKTLEEELKDAPKYKSLYIGGGTPTSLSEEEFEKLLIIASAHYEGGVNSEFCIEINPENTTIRKIKLMRYYGVNRVSIGVQTFNQEALVLLKRKHTSFEVKEVINNLIKEGIDNISLDLIYGLPSQSEADLKADLKVFLELPLKHISLYPLTIEKNTELYNRKIKSFDDDLLAIYYEIIQKTLTKHGFRQYEVSSFALPGYASKHNYIYWTNSYYKGVGPGASGYENRIRYKISANFSNYFKGEIEKDEEYIDDNNYLFEYIMLNFRTIKGINFLKFEKIFGFSFLEKFSDIIKKMKQERLVVVNKYNIRLSKKTLFIEHFVVSQFLKEI